MAANAASAGGGGGSGQLRSSETNDRRRVTAALVALGRACGYTPRVNRLLAVCLVGGAIKGGAGANGEEGRDLSQSDGHAAAAAPPAAAAQALGTIHVVTFAGTPVAVAAGLQVATASLADLRAAVRVNAAFCGGSELLFYRQQPLASGGAGSSGGDDGGGGGGGGGDGGATEIGSMQLREGAAHSETGKAKLLFQPLGRGGHGLLDGDVLFVGMANFRDTLRGLAARMASTRPGEAIDEFTRVFELALDSMDDLRVGVTGKPAESWGAFEYEGQVNERGEPHGLGRGTYTTGSVYIGEWHNGRMHGEGLARWHHGKEFLGTWDDHRLKRKPWPQWPTINVNSIH